MHLHKGENNPWESSLSTYNNPILAQFHLCLLCDINNENLTPKKKAKNKSQPLLQIPVIQEI